MTGPVTIEPDAIYDEPAIIIALDLPSSTLARARSSGMLRFARRGRRTYYLGRWILDWLTARRGEEHHDHADR